MYAKLFVIQVQYIISVKVSDGNGRLLLLDAKITEPIKIKRNNNSAYFIWNISININSTVKSVFLKLFLRELTKSLETFTSKCLVPISQCWKNKLIKIVRNIKLTKHTQLPFIEHLALVCIFNNTFALPTRRGLLYVLPFQQTIRIIICFPQSAQIFIYSVLNLSKSLQTFFTSKY